MGATSEGGRVAGKVALITGAAHGQGRAHAQRLATEGADLVLVDGCAGSDPLLDYRLGTAEELAETADDARRRGARVVTAGCDVRDAEGLVEACRRGVDELGGIDVVVANAGINTMQRWDDVSDELWRTTLDVNLTGAWNTCRAAIPHVVARGGGSVIITSSAGGLKGLPFQQPYVASKHALVGLARSLAHELAEKNVRVNTIHPCGVATPMVERAGESMATLFAEQPDLGPMYMNSLPVVMAEPEDVAAAVLFLASDEARYVTGAAFPIDAGMTSR